MDQSTINNNFIYHAPKPDQIEIYGEIRSRGRVLATYLNDVCPDSREKSLALTKLEECIMWANASIARN